jgi:hypothetical protein
VVAALRAGDPIVVLRGFDVFDAEIGVALGIAAGAPTFRQIDGHGRGRIVVHDHVDAGAPVDPVGARAGVELVVPGVAVKRIVAVAAAEEVIAVVAMHDIGAAGAEQIVVAGGAERRIGGITAVEQVVTRRTAVIVERRNHDDTSPVASTGRAPAPPLS